MKTKRLTAVCATAVVAATLLAGCSEQGGDGDEATTTITLWTPQAGSPDVEIENMQTMLDEFTQQNPEYRFEYTKYPFDSYATSVQGAAAANELPCMLAVDAPNAPSWAWAGWLTPLELPSSLTDSLIPGAKGTYKDQIYSVGYWDAGLALFGRRSVLEAHDIRIPTLADPWDEAEFADVLAKLKTDPDFAYPLSVYPADIYTGTPFLWSFGGDIVDRDTYLTAQGVLNGPDSIAYFEWLKALVTEGYSRGEASDGSPFVAGDVPLIWTGNWEAQSALDTFGDDVVFLPPPDLGNGPTVGAGSFGYGTSSNCTDAQRAGVNKFLEHSMTTGNFVKIADSQYVIPATLEAAQQSVEYGPDGKFGLFAELEAKNSQIRPATPGFAVVADIYNRATADILAGADVVTTLNQAAADIDTDIQANAGYGFE